MMYPWESLDHNLEEKKYKISPENSGSIGKFLVEKIKKETIKSNENICLFQEARNLVAKQKNNQKSILLSFLLNSRNNKHINKEEQIIDEEAKKLIRCNVLNTKGLPETEIETLDISYSSISSIQLNNTHINQLIIENCDEIYLLHAPQYTKIIALKECKELHKISELPSNLEHLIIKSCNKLEKICDIKTAKKLTISNCKTLEKLPNLPDCLEELTVEGCDKISEISNLPRKLKKIKIVNCKSLETLNLPKECALLLKDKGLELRGNKNLKNIDGIDKIPQIKINHIDIGLNKKNANTNINIINDKNDKKTFNVINYNNTKSVGWFLTEICKQDIEQLTELRIWKEIEKIILELNGCKNKKEYEKKTGNNLEDDIYFFSKECIQDLDGLQQIKKEIKKLDISRSGIKDVEVINNLNLQRLDLMIARECTNMVKFVLYKFNIKNLCIHDNNNLESVIARASRASIKNNSKLETIDFLENIISVEINSCGCKEIFFKCMSYCDQIDLISINGIKSIGNSLLDDVNVKIYDTLTINKFTIDECANLEKINLRNNIKKLVIKNCNKLEEVSLNGKIEEIEIVDEYKNINDERKKCELNIPDGIKCLTIKSNRKIISNCKFPKSLKELTICIPINNLTLQENLEKFSIGCVDFSKFEKFSIGCVDFSKFKFKEIQKSSDDNSKKKIFPDSLKELTLEKNKINCLDEKFFHEGINLDKLIIDNCIIDEFLLPEKKDIIKKVFIKNSKIAKLNGLKNRNDIVLIKDDKEFADLKSANINIILLNTLIGECDNKELMEQIEDKKMVFKNKTKSKVASINPIAKANLETTNNKKLQKNW